MPKGDSGDILPPEQEDGVDPGKDTMAGQWKRQRPGRALLGFLCLGLALAGFWTAAAPAAEAVAAGKGEPMATGLVILPGGEEIIVELAVSTSQRARGLMFRDQLPEGQGMLLVFSSSDFRSIWMKNVRFPLDLLWVDKSGRVVHFERSVPPCAEEPCPSYMPLRKASAVLELNAGSIEKWGIDFGDQLVIIPPLH